MNTEHISIRTRQVFREYMTCWVLAEISDEFDAAKIDCDLGFQPQVGGQRRTLIEQYYKTVDWTDRRHVQRVLSVFENVLHHAEKLSNEIAFDQDLHRKRKRDLDKLTWFLRKDGFEWVRGRIVQGCGVPLIADIKQDAASFDATHMADQVRRMEASVDTDPTLAIGTAKELIETCCKTILAAHGRPVSGTPDIPILTKETLKVLHLLPESIPDKARGSEIIKRLLSNLATVGQGIAEIRNLYGSGHGKDGKTPALKPRHAKLAVGAAATLCAFLFDTHQEMAAKPCST